MPNTHTHSLTHAETELRVPLQQKGKTLNWDLEKRTFFPLSLVSLFFSLVPLLSLSLCSSHLAVAFLGNYTFVFPLFFLSLPSPCLLLEYSGHSAFILCLFRFLFSVQSALTLITWHRQQFVIICHQLVIGDCISLSLSVCYIIAFSFYDFFSSRIKLIKNLCFSLLLSACHTLPLLVT